MRWKPLEIPEEGNDVNFIEGIVAVAGAGGPMMKDGLGIHWYACNTSMLNQAFYSSDGDMLIVPQQGDLKITTEFGNLKVSPKEIIVIPRGMKF